MEKKVYDSELGIILIRTHPRARRYALKISEGKVIATMPVKGDEKILFSFIEEKKEQLLGILKNRPQEQELLTENTQLKTLTFSLHIFTTARANFYSSLKEGVLHIACPQQTDFTDERVQSTIKSLIEKTLRFEAKRVLPSRLEELAKQYKFNYNEVKINSSKTRWGSCNGKKNINLSLSLMLLPEHLVDYVLLHELCHTIEMNHSEKFWDLMDKVTDGKAKQLRKELKGYKVFR